MNETLQSMMDTIKEKAAKAGETVESAVNSAGKKTTEIVESTRLKVQITEVQIKIKDACRAIGELVYAAHQDPNTDTECVDAMLSQLDDLHAELTAHRNRREELRLHKQCKQCGKTISRQDSFCRHCGGRSAAATEETP